MNAEHAHLGPPIIDACMAMGFACAGIARASETARRAEFMAWIGSGRHGDMAFMSEYVEERLDVRRLLPGAKSVIVVADQYAVRGDADAAGDGTSVRIARYARGRDYHAVIKSRLHALCDRLREFAPAEGGGGGGMRFRAFVDTGPALEREHASRAAMGGAFVGKHTLLIHPKLGSWLLLGGVATTLELGGGDHRQTNKGVHESEPSAAPRSSAPGAADPKGAHPRLKPGATTVRRGGESQESDRRLAAISTLQMERHINHCGTCTRCIDACPTGAIAPEGWSVDATRCVSYLTLEHRGLIDERFHAGMTDRLIGCDECQAVCPFNAPHNEEENTQERVNPAYADQGGRRARLPILDVLGWSEEDRTQVLSGSAAKRASLEMIKRTAVINATNAWKQTGDPAILRAIQARRDDVGEAAIVRETARQAAAAIEGSQG